jgi:hypothetical protein
MVPWAGREVDPGEIIDVRESELASYLEAGWTEVREESREEVRPKDATSLVGKVEVRPKATRPAGEER